MRSQVETGRTEGWWSVETNVAFRTGPLASFTSLEDPERQLAWLIDERPAYLMGIPPNLKAMALLSRDTGRVPQGLRQVISFTQVLPPDVRALVAEQWNVRVVDGYSCVEFGPIALQCPRHEHFHVQAENLYVEVLREDGTPCGPGETGIVVVTALHNFAMPLLRYELGDYAEVGEPCPCGRGLPVLRRIAGRVRNMARDPNGRRFIPFVPFGGWLEIAPLRGIQLVQTALDLVELRYVMERPLSAAEEERLTRMLQSRLGYPFRIGFNRVERLARQPGGKFEDFISEIG
jgi:phenylacetate-CoA ligase